jgi:CBS domain containing-hemolysin-like protein
MMGETMTRSAELRRRFFRAFWQQLHVVWPILSGLVGAQLVLGLFVGYLEGWRISDATYFTFVTGLTIGYGDLVPVRLIARLIALVIGFSGILLTGLVAALGVRALQEATGREMR